MPPRPVHPLDPLPAQWDAYIRSMPDRDPRVDVFQTWNLLNKLFTPFTEWPAYRLGIIDSHGTVLRKKSTLKTPVENSAWGYYDVLCCNIKKALLRSGQIQHQQALSDMPSGQTLGAAAALYIMKEGMLPRSEEQIAERLFDLARMIEDVAVNSAGGGAVAGIGVGPQGEPPARSSLKLRRKKIVRFGTFKP